MEIKESEIIKEEIPVIVKILIVVSGFLFFSSLFGIMFLSGWLDSESIVRNLVILGFFNLFIFIGFVKMKKWSLYLITVLFFYCIFILAASIFKDFEKIKIGDIIFLTIIIFTIFILVKYLWSLREKFN